jgi:hypothetical protein
VIRTATITLVAAVLLAASGCGGSSTKTSATSQQRLTDLHTISQTSDRVPESVRSATADRAPQPHLKRLRLGGQLGPHAHP